MAVVDCPICERPVIASQINDHLDAGCASFVADNNNNNNNNNNNSSTPQSASNDASSSHSTASTTASTIASTTTASAFTAPAVSTPQPQKRSASNFFSTPAAKRHLIDAKPISPVVVRAPPALAGRKRGLEDVSGGEAWQHQREFASTTGGKGFSSTTTGKEFSSTTSGKVFSSTTHGKEDDAAANRPPPADVEMGEADHHGGDRAPKRIKTLKAAPLAERMRPTTLDEVCGQELVGASGVLRSLIDSDRVPSMILWGPSGTGKTTIARCIASVAGSRFIELNATSSGVAECKRLFAEAANELALTGRKTILFCDEIHRFNKTQQDAFLRPVEAGTITLVGATTENPSFKVTNALLSRCRTFTLAPLGPESVVAILRRAREAEAPAGHDTTTTAAAAAAAAHALVDDDMLAYLARFSDGDARTALNLLELALSLTSRPGITQQDIKQSLTKTLVYDRAGDQHYDTISAFHKSVRGSDPDAALYYLARMLQSGEDPLFVARRMVVIASEDVGLADNSLLPLATAAYTAAQQIGMPEARIPLAHCAVALCLAPKSTRAYRGLNNALAALREPGVAGLPVPLHLRNAPTRLMREMGYGAEYKYPPNYRDGRVKQAYLPDELWDRKFLEARDLGTQIDPAYESPKET